MPKGKSRKRAIERKNAKLNEAAAAGSNNATAANPGIPPANPPTKEPTEVDTTKNGGINAATNPPPEQKVQASQAPKPVEEAAEKVAEGAGSSSILRFAEKKVTKHPLPSFKVDTTAVKLVINPVRPRTIYKYDIKIYRVHDGKRVAVNLSKEEAMTAMELLRKDPTAQQLMKGVFWYDFKALFYSKYSFTETKFSITMSDKVYELVIAPTESMTITDWRSIDERATQALMTSIMYETSLEKKLFCLNGKIFSGKTFPIDRYLFGRLGVSYSVRQTEQGVLLEIDQCATTFVMSGPLIKVLQNIAGSNMMSDMTIGERSIQDINRQLRHIKVYTNYQGYKHKYTFNRLVNKTVASVTFEHEGKTVTMQQYYSQVYKIRLQYPRAPVAEMTKKCFIPIELLFVCDNQRYNMQLTPFQLSQMIKTTASTPRDRKQGTVSFIQANTQFRLLKELEIDIDRRLLDVNAYQLKPPVLDIGGKTVADSSWRNGRFVEKMSISRYLIVVLDQMKGEALCRDFQQLLPKFFTVGRDQPKPIVTALNRLEGILGQTVSRMAQKPDIIFVFIRGQTAEYKEVKRVSDVVLKIPSQCINCAKHTRGLDASVMSNLSLKINMKLGGVNARLSSPLSDSPALRSMMICGADVTHPMNGEKCISVASIVGSINPSHTRYASESTVQQGRQEVIENMRSMMQGLFNAYARANAGRPPAAVVFYRDGVGDQMFEKVLREEIVKIYQAFQDCFPTFPDPLRLTFLICQKRHNMKFYPRMPANCDRQGNANPGLLVDETIVSPDITEFYLQSGVTLKGTGRPCRYTVLVDDCNLPLETLEKLTFNTCFLFNRCSRTIGICAPARYAHLLCFRTRDILRVSDGSDGRSVGSVDSDTIKNQQFESCRNFAYDSSMKTKMFYV